MYTSTSAQSRSIAYNLTYRGKSNSTNAVVMINTIGLFTVRQSVHTFAYTVAVSGKYTNSY